jgi:hypothetical protein
MRIADAMSNADKNVNGASASIDLDFESIVSAFNTAEKQMKEHIDFLAEIKADPSFGNKYWKTNKKRGSDPFVVPRQDLSHRGKACMLR